MKKPTTPTTSSTTTTTGERKIGWLSSNASTFEQRIHEGWFPSFYSMLENETKPQHSKHYESHRIDLKTPTPQFGQCSRTLLRVSLG
ncbi:hypothetical protein Vadar_019837 [Vaccinium darrowii]|uniref:Uncharacterized protein n=1 Tax=Vaccinium darrowii TaxID=229202 RepID=A0ACB7XIQ8_9ERIC|nr:hypothetical protein Vadar_019837 [Vaccinium darrowii]